MKVYATDPSGVVDWSWKGGACDTVSPGNCSKCPPGRSEYPYNLVGNVWEQEDAFTPCCDDDDCTDPNEPSCGTANECGPTLPDCSNNGECTVQGLTCCVDGVCVACCVSNIDCIEDSNTPCCSGSPDFICEACCTSDGDCGTGQCCHLPPEGPAGGQCYSCPTGPCCGSDDPVGLDWDLDPDPRGLYDIINVMFDKVPECYTHYPNDQVGNDGDPINTEQKCKTFCEHYKGTCTDETPGQCDDPNHTGCHTDNNVWWRAVQGVPGSPNGTWAWNEGPYNRVCCCEGDAESDRDWVSPHGIRAPGPAIFNEGLGVWEPDHSKIVTGVSEGGFDSGDWPIDPVNYPNGTCAWVIESAMREDDPCCLDTACGYDDGCQCIGTTLINCGGSDDCAAWNCVNSSASGMLCTWFDLDNDGSHTGGTTFSCLFPECYQRICEAQSIFAAGWHPWNPPCVFGSGCCSGTSSCTGSGNCNTPCYCHNQSGRVISIIDIGNDSDACCEGGSYNSGLDSCG